MVDNFMKRIREAVEGRDVSLEWLMREGGLECVGACYTLYEKGQLGPLRRVVGDDPMKAFVCGKHGGGRSFAGDFPGGDGAWVMFMACPEKLRLQMDEIGDFRIAPAPVFVMD